MPFLLCMHTNQTILYRFNSCSIFFLSILRSDHQMKNSATCGFLKAHFLGGKTSPPKISYTAPKKFLTLLTLSPLPRGSSPHTPKVLQLHPKKRNTPGNPVSLPSVQRPANGGTHKINQNDNNCLHMHFETQQVDVFVSSISILVHLPRLIL